MTINFLNPLLNISKGIGIGHVVHDNNPVGASIVGGGNPESWGRESNIVRVCANNTGTAGKGFGPWMGMENNMKLKYSRSKSLLPGCIPDLQFNCFAIQFRGSNFLCAFAIPVQNQSWERVERIRFVSRQYRVVAGSCQMWTVL